MPVVSAMICAMRGMQAVLPSVMGNSLGVRMGSLTTSLAAALPAGSGSGWEGAGPKSTGALSLQAESSAAEETAPSPSRKARREIITCFITGNLRSQMSMLVSDSSVAVEKMLRL